MDTFYKLKTPQVMILGVGSFAASTMRVFAEHGAQVSTYITRDYAHYGPTKEGEIFYQKDYPNPVALMKEKNIDLVIPMSIDWHLADWADELIESGIPIFSPIKDAMLLERDREYAGNLCRKYGIPFPNFYVASNKIEAKNFIEDFPNPYVLKNPLCRPNSPVHTIACETFDDTKAWLDHIDYSEGVFMQEYMGGREVGHIAFISDGKIYPLVTNQEYKRAFTGNMGPVAGAPLGGLAEADPNDKYGLAKTLLEPLLPWFKETQFYGPVQVTACFRKNVWNVIEYNVRTGVTSHLPILRMLENPLESFLAVANNEPVEFKFKKQFGAVLTLAGWGYPYIKIEGPKLTVQTIGEPDEADIWWNEVFTDSRGEMFMEGHRIADICAVSDTLEEAFEHAYETIKSILCVGSYYRTDIGQIMWPPGEK